MNDKRVIMAICVLLAMVLFSGITVRGETKVLERSAQKVPKWLIEHPKGCLVAIAEATTLQEARNRTELELLRSVVHAIGVSVESQTTVDGGAEEDREWDDFRTALTVRAAQLPFISDVTLAKCNDLYWEHFRDKASGHEAFRVYALYPFGDNKRESMIEEYKAYDARQEASLNDLVSRLKEVSSLEEAIEATATLEALSEWFPDILRRTKAKGTLEQYQDIRKSLSLVAEIVGKGKCRVRIMRGDRPFSVDGRLEVISECASGISISPDEDGWTVNFNTEDCLEYEFNSLTCQFRASGLRLKTTVDF